MDGVKIDLTFERLRAINQALSSLEYQVFGGREGRAQQCILEGVARKLAKKQIDKFPGNSKPFKIEVKYHEAHELELYLRFVIRIKGGDYRVQLVADQLHQKLS